MEFSARTGPFLFGKKRTIADAMYAPDCTRLHTYDVKLGTAGSGHVDAILAMPEMVEWTAAVHQEPEDLAELEMEF